MELLFDGGEVWSASSDSQHEFMIPWKVQKGSTAFTTFNADLSRRVADMLPVKAVNRVRLTGDRLKFKLAEAALARIEERWLNPAISLLRPQYEVERSEITSGASIHYGEDWKNSQPRQENALVVLRRKSFPKRFRDWVILPFRSETVSGTSKFLKVATKYEDLVLSIPWLTELREDGSMEIDLQFVQDRSFSEKAMGAFASDMNANGRSDLAKMVADVQEDTALIIIRFAYCLVLPDKRVILWRFYDSPGTSKVLKWAKADFPSTECAIYRGSERCAGALISPDGELLR